MSYNKETGMYEGYIYKITNINDNCSYIGQTIRDINYRVYEHFYKNNNNGADKDFINRDDFIVDQIECLSCKTIGELCILLDEREKYWIAYFDTYHNGYNRDLGGQHKRNVHDGLKILAYTKQGEFVGKYRTMLEAAISTGANRNDVSKSCRSNGNFLFGNNILFRFESNPLTIEQVEELKLKYPLIYQYSIDGELLNTFKSCADAAEYLRKTHGKNVQSRDVSSKCNKDNITLLGYVWRKYPYSYKDFSVNKRKRIEQHDVFTGKLLNIFDTCQAAANAVNGDPGRIGQVVNKREGCYTSNGYFWCYEGDFNKQYFEKAVKRCQILMNNKNRVSDDEISGSAERTRNIVDDK